MLSFRFTWQHLGKSMRVVNFGSCRLYSNLNKTEVAEKMKSGVILIDVRTPTEFADSGTIEVGGNKGKNIPLDDLGTSLGLQTEEFERKYGFPKPKPSDEIIFTCAAGRRGKKAAELADQLNYTKTYNYVGGMIDWLGKSIKH